MDSTVVPAPEDHAASAVNTIGSMHETTHQPEAPFAAAKPRVRTRVGATAVVHRAVLLSRLPGCLPKCQFQLPACTAALWVIIVFNPTPLGERSPLSKGF